MLAYKQRVREMEQAPESQKNEVSDDQVGKLDIRVVVGYFEQDEVVVEEQKPKFCKALRGDPILVNVVRAFKEIPSNPQSDNYDTFVDIGERVEVIDVRGDWYKIITPRFATQRWVEKKLFGACER